MTDPTTNLALARVSHWHSEGCPTELADSRAYGDLDESDDPLHHDIGVLLAELGRRHVAIDSAHAARDRARGAVRKAFTWLREAHTDRDRARDLAVKIEHQNAAIVALATDLLNSIAEETATNPDMALLHAITDPDAPEADRDPRD